MVDPALLKINYNIFQLMPKDQPQILSNTLGDLFSEILPTILLFLLIRGEFYYYMLKNAVFAECTCGGQHPSIDDWDQSYSRYRL